MEGPGQGEKCVKSFSQYSTRSHFEKRIFEIDAQEQ